MDDWMINLASTVIGGVVSSLIVTRLSGGERLASGQEASVAGNHNTVTQVDASTHEHNIYTRLPSPERRPSSPAGSDSADDTAVMLLLAGIACVALVLTYLFVWPALVWTFAGGAMGIAVMTIRTYVRTRGGPGPRRTALALTLLSSGLLLLTAWWTLYGGPGSAASNAGLEAAVIDVYPAFDDGLSQRWDVTVDHWWDIIQILGWGGVLYILTQVLTLEAAVFLVWQRTREVIGWVALGNLADDPYNATLTRRAGWFKGIGPAGVVGTLLGGLIIVVVSGGWLHSWLEDAQDQRVLSVVDTR